MIDNSYNVVLVLLQLIHETITRRSAGTFLVAPSLAIQLLVVWVLLRRRDLMFSYLVQDSSFHNPIPRGKRSTKCSFHSKQIGEQDCP
jgi:hypothetical protein